MGTAFSNYDGSVTCSPAEVVYPETVEQIQAVLRDAGRYPGPVRAMGSNHSLTECAVTGGTVVNMSKMRRVIAIDAADGAFTAEAGLQLVDASDALREKNLQFHTNAEIGNMTLGAAACCQTKDALDGIEFGQFSSYVSKIKWVTPSGDLAEASAENDAGLLRRLRSSYGLAGVVYEVTIKVKPLEILQFEYTPRAVADLTEDEVEKMLNGSEGLVAWTIGRKVVFQRRTRVVDPGAFSKIEAWARRRIWAHDEAYVARLIDRFIHDKTIAAAAHEGQLAVDRLLFDWLESVRGIRLYAPDKIIDYRESKPSARYAFTFWAFPRKEWLTYLREYLDFADAHYAKTGFRCNMPLGSYFIRRDEGAILSYSHDGDIFSIDPIHAPEDTPQWFSFLRAFNEFAHARGGVPLLNQSPLIEQKHVEAAYGARWSEYSRWIREMDPAGRMLNPFFASLLSP